MNEKNNSSFNMNSVPTVPPPAAAANQPVIVETTPGQPLPNIYVQPVGQPQPVVGQPMLGQPQPVYVQVPDQSQLVLYYPPQGNTSMDPPPAYTEKATTPSAPQEVVIMVNSNQVPRHSAKLRCPHCNKTVDTVVQYEDNALVWVLCIILFIFTFLCCIPFCINDLKDAVHYCPICKNEIAKRERLV